MRPQYLVLALAMGCMQPVNDEDLGVAVVDHRYLVTVAPGADVDSTLDSLGLRVTHRYYNVMRGGAVVVPNSDEATLAKLRADARIASIDADQELHAIGKPPPPPPPPPPSQTIP